MKEASRLVRLKYDIMETTIRGHGANLNSIVENII